MFDILQHQRKRCKNLWSKKKRKEKKKKLKKKSSKSNWKRMKPYQHHQALNDRNGMKRKHEDKVEKLCTGLLASRWRNDSSDVRTNEHKPLGK
jgi:hypothetical protein